MDNKEFSKELEKGLDDLVNYLLFSHLLEQSRPLTLVTLDTLGTLVTLVAAMPRYELIASTIPCE